MSNEQEKQVAARRSLDFVRDGYVVGLGTGSTAFYAITYLGGKGTCRFENMGDSHFRQF